MRWLIAVSIWGASLGVAIAADMPRVLDERLKIELVAAEPEIVTPTGIAVDDNGRVLVIESHSHFRPKDYQGPPADRIRRLSNFDSQGRAGRVETIFEGTQYTMNLAVYHDGSLYVATRNEVFRLRDKDGDDTPEERTPLVQLVTKGNYPHNGLSGFAFDFAGNVYFGFGENLGESYELVGSDGKKLTGGGEGGNIYRCRADGSEVTRIATGFWNPFHLCFDAYERLFAVDNDPDSRPPCRLLHVVPDGDYGYRFRNGRKGLHPFTAWNGELPGTLPMVAGTGEAPSGIVCYESDNLPDEYRGNLLGTSWGDHRIERFRLLPRGASFVSTGEPLVVGNENFRPVGIALAPDGSLFVSDWVDKSYPIHGKGRVWRISAKDPKPRQPAADINMALASPDRRLRETAARTLANDKVVGVPLLQKAAKAHADPKVQALAILALSARGIDFAETEIVENAGETSEVRSLKTRLAPRQRIVFSNGLPELPPLVRAEVLRRIEPPFNEVTGWLILFGLNDDDPFLRQAAQAALERAQSADAFAGFKTADTPRWRIAGLLAARNRLDDDGKQLVGKLLDDPDPDVRFLAVQIAAEYQLKEFRPQLVAGLNTAASAKLFEAYLAAIGMVDGAKPVDIDKNGTEPLVAKMAIDPATASVVRRRALRMLRPDHPKLTTEFLETLAKGDEPSLRLEAIRTLREQQRESSRALLASLAADESRPVQERAEALMGLKPQDAKQRESLVKLLASTNQMLVVEALRTLRGTAASEQERKQFKSAAANDPSLEQYVHKLLLPAEKPALPAKDQLDDWMKRLEGQADAAAGERIFFHSQAAGCYRCHQMEGRGGKIGPELSTTAKKLTRERLVESIVWPDKDVAPMFTAWQIVKQDGTIAIGQLVSEAVDGTQTYADKEGKLFAVKPGDIDERHPQRSSIMPEGLPAQMTIQEFRDLLAYLQGK